jgi:hypothetical protein
VVEVLSPRTIADLTGVRSLGLIQLYGVREFACGMGILSSTRPVGWLWGRVAGDVVDLATLIESEDGPAAMGAAIAVAGVTVLDVINAGQLSAAAALEG